MIRRFIAIIATLALLTVSPPSLLARPTQLRSTWDELSRMIPGMDIRIVLPDATTIRGRAIQVGPDALVMDVRRTSNPQLHAKGQRTEIPRSDVSTIDLFLRRSREDPDREAGAIGAGIAGAAVSPLVLSLGDSEKVPEGAVVAIFLGAIVGGAILATHIFNRHNDDPRHVVITVVSPRAVPE